MTTGILSYGMDYFAIFASLVALTYSIGFWYGIRTRNTFFLSALPFSSIIILSAFLFDLSDDAPMLLTITVFIISSVTLVVHNLIHLAKKKSA